MAYKILPYFHEKHSPLFTEVYVDFSFTAECDDPTPANGSAAIPNGHQYGATAYISCDDGFDLVGDPYITCLNGSIWSSYPTCIRGTCNCSTNIFACPVGLCALSTVSPNRNFS